MSEPLTEKQREQLIATCEDALRHTPSFGMQLYTPKDSALTREFFEAVMKCVRDVRSVEAKCAAMANFLGYSYAQVCAGHGAEINWEKLNELLACEKFSRNESS